MKKGEKLTETQKLFRQMKFQIGKLINAHYNESDEKDDLEKTIKNIFTNLGSLQNYFVRAVDLMEKIEKNHSELMAQIQKPKVDSEFLIDLIKNISKK